MPRRTAEPGEYALGTLASGFCFSAWCLAAEVSIATSPEPSSELVALVGPPACSLSSRVSEGTDAFAEFAEPGEYALGTLASGFCFSAWCLAAEVSIATSPEPSSELVALVEPPACSLSSRVSEGTDAFAELRSLESMR